MLKLLDSQRFDGKYSVARESTHPGSKNKILAREAIVDRMRVQTR